ncbi:response regulator transcription factor [Cohnella cellulosilytica]|uniref:Response regulator n=1 Tax=Cohnella cellulosilytica TaxID=986710 RepID=A0ABW2FCB8_9BACL
MHSVLIVDDDAMIIKGLEQFVDWQDMGFRIVGTAQDGEEGIEAIRALKPEVVLTDIKMPYKDGLDMIEDCLRDGMTPHFVVLTGFNEFEYARRALKSRVSDYLLKPVEERELISVLGGIRAHIEGLERNKADWNALQTVATESFSLVRGKLIRDLVAGAVSPSSIGADKLAYYDLDLTEACYQVALLQGDAPFSDVDRLEEVVAEVCRRRGIRSYMACEDGTGTLLLGGGQDIGRRVGESLDEIIGKIKERTGAAPTIGVSETGGLSGLPELCRQAEFALRHKLFRGVGSVIAFSTLPQENASRLPDPEEQARRLLAAVSENDEAAMQTELDVFFEEIRRAGMAPQDVYRVCTELLYEVRKALGEIGIARRKLEEEEVFSSDGMRRHDTMDGLRGWLGDSFQRVRAHFDRSFEHTGGEQIDNILLYMNTHYAEPIDLDVISRTFFIDPSYFCKVFKKRTGETYLHYLTRVRIDKACRLLGNPSNKVYEIASRVGYEDQRYFSQVFRKHTGMTPSEYQRSRTKN